MALKLISSSKCFEGEQRVYSHFSQEIGCEMQFGLYMPPAAIEDNHECPVLYYLSGLTCTHENFIQKSGMQRYAAQHNIVVVNPDTSPRNLNIAGQDDSTNIGYGAGFYVDATKEPWSKNYRMYSYVTKELITLVKVNFPVQPKQGITGHSMGGHGALICALKNPGLYQSISVFAPVANPSKAPIGQFAFKGYLGDDKEEWKCWDATHLAECYSGTPVELFIDQGTADSYLHQKELLPENLLATASTNDHIQTIYKLRDGYDHGYFYVSTFMAEHMEYHAKFLKA